MLYGGYSRVKTSVGTSGRQAKGQPQRMSMKPVIHQDAWFLRITPPAPDAAASVGPSISWERRKKPANSPNPPRAGVTMAYHKGRGIMFGGVHDVELSDEGMDSEFFGELYAWNIDRNRFFPLNLRRPKATGKKASSNQVRTKERSKADEEELLQNLAALEMKQGLSNSDDRANEAPSSDVQEKDEQQDRPARQAVVRFELPHRRFNSQLAIQDDSLFILGGTFEKGDREFTFNDMYSVDLDKLNGVKEIFYNEPENWNLMDAGDSEDGTDEDEDQGQEEEGDEETTSLDAVSTVTGELSPPSIGAELEFDMEEAESTIQDGRPLPRACESLREYFGRTSEEWQRLLIGRLRERGSNDTQKTVKELRKEAFSMAEEKWWDSREEIMALEDEQEAAGIGEVVNINIADRGDGSAVRRR